MEAGRRFRRRPFQLGGITDRTTFFDHEPVSQPLRVTAKNILGEARF